MSCETLNSQSVGLNVAIGNLPEGFCPASMQELAQAIAARLIVTPSQSFNGMAIGSIEPTSNVGLWFKNCEELFIFDDATARYIPLQIKGGFKAMEYRTASDTFVVPEFIFTLKVTTWGAGGGGSGQFGAGTPGSGGGAGAMGTSIFSVIPGQSIAFVVGTGGSGGVSIGGAGGNGGATTFLTMSSGGGLGAPAVVHMAGKGGTPTGATFSIIGGYGDGGDNDPGVGGSSPQGGQGGVSTYGGVPEADTFTGRTPGGGGSGGHHSATGQQLNGGSGAGGAVLIEF